MNTMKILYQTKAVSTGGRDGHVQVQNSPLSFDMAVPKEMGGNKTEGVNPEQLFAAGYSACFGSALQHVFRLRKLDIAPPDVHVTVGIGRNDAGGFVLAADILAVFTGIDQDTADSLTREAHQVCPYSNATRGNIEVTVAAEVE
jgi:osmotically inducible protein OsmC